MVNIGEIQSEVVVGEDKAEVGEPRKPEERKLHDIREAVRAIVREEIDRFLRTEARG